MSLRIRNFGAFFPLKSSFQTGYPARIMNDDARENGALSESQKSKNAQLTKEDVLRISAIPVRKMRVGNIIQEVICDEVTGFIYYPNPDAAGPYDRLLPKRTPYVPEKDNKPEPPLDENDDEEDNEDEDKKSILNRLPQVVNRAVESKKKKIPYCTVSIELPD